MVPFYVIIFKTFCGCKMNYQNHYLNEEGIHPGALKLISEAHEDVKHLFYEIEERAQYHQSRILNIFAKHRVSQRHFNGTTAMDMETMAEIPWIWFSKTYLSVKIWYAPSGFQGLM